MLPVNVSMLMSRFTGKERDAETGLDFFGARYYSGAQGRFTSVDPGFNLRAMIANPQRWNRYAYVSNNPLLFVDPDGREQVVIMNGKTYMGGVDGMSAGDKHAKNVVFAGLVAGTAATAAGVSAPGLLAAGRGLLSTLIGYLISPQEQQTATNAIEGLAPGPTGNFANEIGAAREATVAAITKGEVSGMKISLKGVGSTDVDVIGAAMELIGVGGPAKGGNLAEFGSKLKVLQGVAEEMGVKAQYHFEKGTPQEVIDFAKKRLGDANVIIFNMEKLKK
jgi:RHS repeat-associated protein